MTKRLSLIMKLVEFLFDVNFQVIQVFHKSFEFRCGLVFELCLTDLEKVLTNFDVSSVVHVCIGDEGHESKGKESDNGFKEFVVIHRVIFN